MRRDYSPLLGPADDLTSRLTGGERERERGEGRERGKGVEKEKAEKKGLI